MSSPTKYPYIVREEGPQGERAMIEGTSLAVWNIANDYYNGNLSVDEIVRKRDLTPSRVHSALAYYHDHRAEVDQARREDRIEALCAEADRAGIGKSFRALVEAGEKHHPPGRVNKNSIMFAPPTNRRICLFTVWATPRRDSLVPIWINPDLFSELYHETQEEVTRLLGQAEWRDMNHSEVEDFVQGLDQLVARLKSPLELNSLAPPETSSDRPVERPTLDMLYTKADRSGIGESFRALVAAGQKHNLPWYIHKRSGVRFAPPADRRLVLFYVRAKPVQDNMVHIWLTTTRFPQFYPVTQEEVKSLLGPSRWRDMAPLRWKTLCRD